MLNELCPHCARPMGWGGPKGDFSAAQRSVRGKVRWHCPLCGGELKPLVARSQVWAQVVWAVTLLAYSFAGLWRSAATDASPMPSLLFYLVATAIIVSSSVWLWMLLTRRQWAVLDAESAAGVEGTGTSSHQS